MGGQPKEHREEDLVITDEWTPSTGPPVVCARTTKSILCGYTGVYETPQFYGILSKYENMAYY
jgi:hypothetical protein